MVQIKVGFTFLARPIILICASLTVSIAGSTYFINIVLEEVYRTIRFTSVRALKIILRFTL